MRVDDLALAVLADADRYPFAPLRRDRAKARPTARTTESAGHEASPPGATALQEERTGGSLETGMHFPSSCQPKPSRQSLTEVHVVRHADPEHLKAVQGTSSASGIRIFVPSSLHVGPVRRTHSFSSVQRPSSSQSFSEESHCFLQSFVVGSQVNGLHPLTGCMTHECWSLQAVVRREDELLKLLDWLVKQGDAPDDLIRILLARGIGAPRSEATTRWLATVLVTTSRWKTFGPPVLKQLLAAGGWEAMTLLLTESVKNAEAANHPDRKRGIVGAIHEAIAVVLLHRLREATAAGADGEACAALRGLAGLQPPARLSEQLHLLRKKNELPPDVLELVNLNLSLLRHGTTRGAQLFDAEVALSLYRESATLAAEI